MLKRVGSLLITAATLAACSESTVPTGATPDIPASAQQSVLATLSCRVDVAAQQMTCAPSTPAGPSADLILGGQNTYVKLTSSVTTSNATQVVANVNVKNLTVQPWATTDGTTADPNGVRVFFYTPPTSPVTVNGDGTGTFTAAGQQYFQYSAATLGGDGILSSGETSLNKSWTFTLNGATTFTFQVLISAAMPDEQGVLRWTPSTLSKTGAFEEIDAIWGSSSTDVWAGGTEGATSLHHWDGSSWTASAGAETTPILAMWGSSSSNVYAVGGPKIQRYNGTTWSDVTSGASAGLLAVWGSSATDVYAGGLNGTLVHSTGGAFSPVASTGLGTEVVAAIWGSSSTDVYTGGVTLRHWDGANWSAVSGVTVANVRSIWGTSPTDVWVGAASGELRHLSGTTWSTLTLGSGDISGIWGTSASDVYAVNRAGEIYHWNGSTWVLYSGLNTTNGFTGIWGSGRKDIWTVGSDNTFSTNVVVHGTR